MSSRGEARRASVMEYEQSVLFGQYHEKLAGFARLQARKQPRHERMVEDLAPATADNGHLSKKSELKRRLIKVMSVVGNWPLLICLGIIIAFLSFAVDIATGWLLKIREMSLHASPHNNWSSYGIWVVHSMACVMGAAVLVRYVSPQAAGAGVAEMKVIIRGVVIKEYLTFKTLIAKVIGVPFVLASGLGTGKEGPFVHISSMVSNLLFKLFSPVTVSPTEYESRFQELITIAAAVGVAATFAAPIGSVLYSIEIVKCFFAVRSYWEGFFAATWGALLWRLFAVWFQIEDNISHILLTEFRKNYPYETMEVLLFALLGLICGLLSFLFVQLVRTIVKFNRKKGRYNDFLQRYPLVYPLVVGWFIATVKYPNVIGQFSSSYMTMEQSMHELFSNFTWHEYEQSHQIHHGSYHAGHHDPNISISHEAHVIANWSSEHSTIFINTFLFVVSNFFTIALASTCPVPGGLIVPLFMLGAGVGRFFGEWAAYMFPYGLNPLDNSPNYLGIIPGAYAVAASAAMCGGVTGSLSVAVIAFEITGQLTHFLPIIVCVLCSNLVARYLGPTIYESTIELKNLPFLPVMIKASTISHRVLVEDFMDTDVIYIWKGCTYRTIHEIIQRKDKLAFYPFVSSPDQKFLLGIIHYLELKHVLDRHMHQSGKASLKSDKHKGSETESGSEESGSTNSSPQVTFNGRFQIWSNFGPHKVAVLNKAVWDKRLNETVDFSKIHIDPAPLQMMEGTPLSNIHNLFSLLSLQVVYVTSLGRLTGVVTLKGLRKTIECVERGEIPMAADKKLKSVRVIQEEAEPLNNNISEDNDDLSTIDDVTDSMDEENQENNRGN